jgi:hypothetical protein
MWPINAKLAFGAAGLAIGTAGAGVLAKWGDPTSPLHLLIAGQASNLVMVTIVAVLGATVVEFWKGK